jgi:hypothetical protein
MALEIVWRNPLPLARTVQKVQRISSDEFRAVYAVAYPNILPREFELLSGKAA